MLTKQTLVFTGLSLLGAAALADQESSELNATDQKSATSIEVASADDSKLEWVSVRGAYFGKQVSDSVKTPTLLLNVPQSVTVIEAEDISQRALFSVADIMQYTPGVSVGQGEDHRDQITIRGQNTTADFFVDGLRDDVQYFRPLYNIERVEVLRGANALLFGRGGGGGIVNRVTKEADVSESFAAISAGVDTFSASSVSIDGNAAVSDTQALRLNAVFDSIENHRDFKDGERYAVNPTYTWVADENTRLKLSYEYVNDDRVVDRGVPALNGEPLTGFDETFFGDPDFNRTTFEGQIARAHFEHRFSEQWTITSILQYADYDKFYQNLYPVNFSDVNQEVTLDGYRDTTDRENTLLQINLVGQIETGNVSHTILSGVEYGQQNTQNARNNPEFAQAALDPDTRNDQLAFAFSDPLNIPAYRILPAAEDASSRDRESEVSFVSVFIQDEIELSDEWIAVLGLRFDSFDIDVVNLDGTREEPLTVSGDDSEVSPRAGLIYKPNEEISIYASYSKSFLPRSGDQFLTLSLSAAALDPEEFENREIGVKWNISDDLTLNLAYFEVERDSGSTVDPNDPERSILVGTETDGFEVQLVGNVTENWLVNLGYSYLDGSQVGNVSGGEIDNAELAQLPENMFTLWNKVLLNDKWQLGAGIIHQSEQYASLSNNVELPDFTRVDAAIYYQPVDALSFQLNIENLLDEEYFPAAHNDNNITTGEPLNARLGVTYTF